MTDEDKNPKISFADFSNEIGKNLLVGCSIEIKDKEGNVVVDDKYNVCSRCGHMIPQYLIDLEKRICISCDFHIAATSFRTAYSKCIGVVPK